MTAVDDRGVWEEQLWTSNTPLPRRPMTKQHPMYGLPRQYIDGDQVLAPWSLWALVEPIPPEWLPLPEHHEAVYLIASSGQRVRVGLVNYAEGLIVAWRKTGRAKAWQPAKPRTKPEPDQPAADPLTKPRRARTRTRRRTADPRPADMNRTTR